MLKKSTLLSYTTILLLCLINFSAKSQITISDKSVNVLEEGYYRDFEWQREIDEDMMYKDTLYTILSYKQAKELIIYFDNEKLKKATSLNYNIKSGVLAIQHFNRKGMLIKEIQFNTNIKTTAPWKITVRQLIFLKAYTNDSLIYEMNSYETSIVTTYKNYLTKRHFKKTEYFAPSEHGEISTGETFWEYYPNGTLKSSCIAHIEVDRNPETGEEISTMVYNCHNFDENGCQIK